MENCASVCCPSLTVSQAQSKSPSAEVGREATVECCSGYCALQHNIYYIHGFSWFVFFFPNISAEILEEADLQLHESVYQAVLPYIWWFACCWELDQRLCSDGFITDKPLNLLLHLLADKEDTTGMALSSEVLKKPKQTNIKQ